MVPNTAAYCGLYCESCPLFQQTQLYLAGKGEKPDEMCEGCASDNLGKWCSQCNLKNCAKEKAVRFCIECSEYACRELLNFADSPEYPYHKEVFTNLMYIKKEGVENWMKQQKSRWGCIKCGTAYNWWQKNCTHCGSSTKGYTQPRRKE